MDGLVVVRLAGFHAEQGLAVGEGGDGAEALYDGREFLYYIVHFFLGVVDTEGEADRTVGVGLRHGHGHEDVRGLERAGGAGGAGGGADAFLADHQQDGLSFDVFEADIGGIGQAVRAAAVHAGIRYLQQAGLEAVPQAFHIGIFFFEVGPGQLGGFAYAGDIRHVLSAGAAAMFLVAAHQEGGEA